MEFDDGSRSHYQGGEVQAQVLITPVVSPSLFKRALGRDVGCDVY